MQAEPPDFSTTTKSRHFECSVVIPPGLPAMWETPVAYILGAVNKAFAETPAYLHFAVFPNEVLFVSREAQVRDEIQTFATNVLRKMAHPTTTFQLQVTGIRPLNDEQLRVLLGALGGNITQLKYTGNLGGQDYGHTALVHLQHRREWDPSDKKLP